MMMLAIGAGIASPWLGANQANAQNAPANWFGGSGMDGYYNSSSVTAADYQTVNEWDILAVPTTANDIFVGLGGAVQVQNGDPAWNVGNVSIGADLSGNIVSTYSGELDQTGSSMSVNGHFYLGSTTNGTNVPDIGTYQISAGTLTTTGIFSVGNSGTGGAAAGYFNMTGGSVTSGAAFQVSNGANGYVNMSGGKLTLNGPFQIGDNAGGTGSVVINGNASVVMKSFTSVGEFSGSIGTLTLAGNSTYNASGQDFNIADLSGGTGTVTIQDSASLTASYIGLGKNGAGATTLNVKGGTVTTTGDIEVGKYSGNDTLNLAGGTMTIGGYGYIGNDGAAAVLNVSSGSLAVAGDLYFGSGANTSSATVNITGGSVSAGGQIWVGQSGGTATVNMSNGTLTNSNYFVIGYGGSAIGTVNLSGGTVVVNNQVFVGADPSTAALNITGGTFNASGDINVGDFGGAVGTITLSNGTINGTPSENSWIGEGSGTGTLNMSGGVYNALGQFIVGQSTGSIGVVNLTGGTLTVGSWLSVGRQGGTGTLNLSGTGVLHHTAGAEVIIGSDATNSVGLFSQTGGTFIDDQQTTSIGTEGTGTYNLSGGTASIHAILFCEVNDNSSTLPVGTVNLSGTGLLTLSKIEQNYGIGTFNFNGGTLQVGDASNASSFFVGVTHANIQAGGALINTNGFSVTIGESLASGVMSGVDGGLTKIGQGTLTLSGSSTYTGGTVVNVGTLALAGGNTNTGIGCIVGSVTVNSGATMVAQSPNAFGWNSASTAVTLATVNGGTLSTTATGDQGWLTVFNLSGGTLTSNGGVSSATATSYWDLGAGGAVNTIASATQSVISGRLMLRGDGQSNFNFNVAQGTLASGTPDLLVSAAITQMGQTAGANPGITKLGAGTMTLMGSNSYTGGTTVSAGRLVFGAPNALPAGTALTVLGGAKATAAAHTSGLTGAAKNNLIASSLTLAGSSGSWTGRLDLNNNDMVVQTGSLATITNQVAQGYNGGTWNNTGGIVSNSAASDTSHLTALAVVQNNQGGADLFTASNPFDGVTPADGAILVKYTYYGDANLSGTVDGSDYTLIDNGFNNHLTGWYNGDFNYDGVVDGSDYTLIDNAFNTQGAVLAAQFAPAAQLSGSGATSAVPEPASLTLVALAAGGLLRRRRK